MLGILKIMERNKFTFLFLLFFILFTSNVSAITTTNKTTITSGSLTNGAISITSSTSKADETVTFTVTPANGYKLKAGTLKYTYDYFDTSTEAKKSKTVALDDTATSLTIPSRVRHRVYVPDTCYEEPVCTPGEETCKLDTSCANKCAGMYDNCLDMCTVCTPGPDVCTGGGPYDCSYYDTTYYYTSNITITAEFEPDIANYTVYHYIEQLDGSYKLYATETKSGTIGSNVDLNSIIKSVKGFFKNLISK